MITRLLKNGINKDIFKGKTIILYGARHIGVNIRISFIKIFSL